MHSNLKIVITRSEPNASVTEKQAIEYGFIPIVFPLLELSAIKDVYLRNSLDFYDWIIFTSANAVRYFFGFLNKNQLKIEKKIRIACVGLKTAESLKEYNTECHYMPVNYSAEDLAKNISIPEKSRILYPALLNDPTGMEKALVQKDYIVDRLDIYESQPVIYKKSEWLKLIEMQPDILSFFSPKAVRYFMDQKPVTMDLKQYLIAVLGKSTAEELKKFNIHYQIQSDMNISENLFNRINMDYAKITQTSSI